MGLIIRLALELAGLSARQMARRVARVSILAVVALIFVLIGLTGFTAALWIVLAHQTNPLIASLIIGGAGFVLAGITALIAGTQMRGRRHVPAPPLIDAERAVSDFMANANSGTIWTPLIAAALVGFLVTGRK
jgi:cytochrome c biogenesis protein CcdA